MTTKLKCPFCKGKLDQVFIHTIQGWACTKLECKGYFMTATKDMWQELIHTKKQLEIARKALEEYANKDNWGCIEDDRDRVWHTYWYFDGCDDGGWNNAEKALEQITHDNKGNNNEKSI